MSESNGNGSAALKVTCGVLSGMLGTVLFVWISFPKDLAKASDITALAQSMQKQYDGAHQEVRDLQRVIDVDRRQINHLNVEMARVTLKDGVVDEPGDWQP